MDINKILSALDNYFRTQAETNYNVDVYATIDPSIALDRAAQELQTALDEYIDARVRKQIASVMCPDPQQTVAD